MLKFTFDFRLGRYAYKKHVARTATQCLYQETPLHFFFGKFVCQFFFFFSLPSRHLPAQAIETLEKV